MMNRINLMEKKEQELKSEVDKYKKNGKALGKELKKRDDYIKELKMRLKKSQDEKVQATDANKKMGSNDDILRQKNEFQSEYLLYIELEIRASTDMTL